MNLLLVTDAFPPMRTSGAELMHSLVRKLVDQSHQVWVVIPRSNLKRPVLIEQISGYTLVHVRAYETKDVSLIRRAFAEIANSFLIQSHLRKNEIFMGKSFDGLIWYSPTIFWGSLIHFLKKYFKCRAYLVLRDLFPDWALHLGLLSKNGIPYWFFKLAEKYQYKQADVIGIQSPNNLNYFKSSNLKINSRLEVLWNWIAEQDLEGSPSRLPVINLASTKLANKIVFVYAGNMGVAQGVNSLIELINFFSSSSDIGFLIIGRGSALPLLREREKLDNWGNVLFYEEVAPEDIVTIIKQCHIGLVLLDERHRTHNIPGKFLSYLGSGLPVLAKVNVGNDLLEMIPSEGIGQVWAESINGGFVEAAQKILQDINNYQLSQRARNLVKEKFSVDNAAKQIIEALQECK